MSEKNKKSFMLISLISIFLLVFAVIFSTGTPIGFNTAFALTRATGVVTCPNGLRTDIADNISREEIEGLKSFNEANIKKCSTIIDSIDSISVQRDTTYNSIKVGAASTQGSITFTLNRSIKAVGFYACAYQNDKDTGKYLIVNDIQLDKALPECQEYIYSDSLRFFYELPAASSEVTIKAAAVTNNRFHIYSVGFYY